MEMKRKLLELYRKFRDFIVQDVDNDNETKRASVIMRAFALVMCWYFLALGVTMSVCREWDCAIVSLICMIGYMVAFCYTYLNHTRIAMLYTMISTVGWVLLFVVMFGWDYGVQQLLIALTVFFFAASYAPVRQKACVAASLCLCRLALYGYTLAREPVIKLNPAVVPFLQVANAVAIYVAVALIIILFSKDTLAMEKKLVRYNEKLIEASRIDPLTKLYNRRAVLEYIDEMIERVERRDGWFNIAIGDIDFFKKVNDTYGHEAGDAVLVHVADILADFMKEKGCVGRWGGEEFLLVFKDINGEEAVIELERIRALVERQKIRYQDQEISVTMTFGLDEYSNNHPIDYTINSADQKLYIGKSRGRNRVIF